MPSLSSVIYLAIVAELLAVTAVAQQSESGTATAAEADLRKAVERFIAAADRGNVADVSAMYHPDFVNIRVADEGGVVRLTREQVLQFLARPGVGSLPTKETTVQHAEVADDQGLVFLVRVKDLGQGWEPMFYSLVWKKQGGDWRLWREFVHQRRLPKPH